VSPCEGLAGARIWPFFLAKAVVVICKNVSARKRKDHTRLPMVSKQNQTKSEASEIAIKSVT
jgi:hypothetical protein